MSAPPLPDAERLLRTILDESREALALGDLSGQIRIFSRAAEDLC